jgi:hypothetical protein
MLELASSRAFTRRMSFVFITDIYIYIYIHMYYTHTHTPTHTRTHTQTHTHTHTHMTCERYTDIDGVRDIPPAAAYGTLIYIGL